MAAAQSGVAAVLATRPAAWRRAAGFFRLVEVACRPPLPGVGYSGGAAMGGACLGSIRRSRGAASVCVAWLGCCSAIGAPVKSCTAADVVSARVSAGTGKEFPFGPSASRIDAAPVDSHSTGGSPDANAQVVAFGPTLNSSYSRAVATEFVCTDGGVALVATITWDPGAPISKDIQWRPKIELGLLVRKSPMPFETTWKARLEDGTPVGRARTPGGSEQEYPITEKATVLQGAR